MESEEREVKLRDDDVLVVAGVGDDGPLPARPGQVPGSVEVDEELDRCRPVELGRPVVQEAVSVGTAAVDAVQVEEPGAQVRAGRLITFDRHRVECQVVVDELAEEGEPDGQASGLTRCLVIRQVTPDIGIAAGRIARSWYRAKGLTKAITVERVDQATGRVTYRRSTVRRKLFAHARGFICLNDGAAFAAHLGLFLAS